jgi:hypothetical protein
VYAFLVITTEDVESELPREVMSFFKNSIDFPQNVDKILKVGKKQEWQINRG